ncbi:NADH dehydrogenase [ubiquinone] 1 alpha subcomplex subunit 1 [Mucuna pruriens]|uniref:NADH dehydrogenase [ubiquinone] 1 alpha subcomplex subunit 1 n=1 Tax=Mucuna pruriens TaxID=157652 RepID=A0A371HA54_MUCPR|nr:NADH dehydrogenase [ubiquinone] 1 alpha subcomplex subunit 1 [Mucuna pruriens]
MDGSGVAAGNHSWNALCYGKRSVLHSQSRAWQSWIFVSDVKFFQPKHIGNDMWDVAMERRDKKLHEQASASN